VDAFVRFTDKPIGLIGVARGPSPSARHARYCRQPISIDQSEDGVWIIPPFTAEAAPAGTPAAQTAGGAAAGTTAGPQAAGRGIEPADMAGRETTTAAGAGRIRRIYIEGVVSLDQYGELFRCFVGPAARMNLRRLELGVRFVLEATETAPLDLDDADIRAMRESARQLGLKFRPEDGEKAAS
jgi:hypothetical protein